jgi:DNA-binding NtrC family response regulator
MREVLPSCGVASEPHGHEQKPSRTHPEIQVIFVSGYAESFADAQQRANCTFLQKPFRFATLLEQLKLMRQKR